jgi:hypothetical protein
MGLPGRVDSNSPAVWLLDEGISQLRVLTSSAGVVSLSVGTEARTLGPATPVEWTTHPGHGVWMESVLVAEDGTWYGYYHNEIPATVCDRQDRMVPRLGAARSVDAGRTWEDLGVILEAPEGWHACATRNRYFVGGVGDAVVVRDSTSQYVYLFFSQYSRSASAQGVGVARLAWADRDEPTGRVEVWTSDAWLPARHEVRTGTHGEPTARWAYDAGTPLWPVLQPWHDGNASNDAFWGPSVHWNASLQRFVMLLNRAANDQWAQDGVYVAFSTSLENPRGWTTPVQLLDGGTWYPQILGLESGQGTDTWGTWRARLFIGGSSNYFVDFELK